MFAFLARLLGTDGFMPHGHCYLWKPELVWLHFWSDLLIGLSYVAISLTLVYLVRRSQGDIPFHGMFLAFGAFIVACGGTHFMEMWNIWHASYWASGWVKVVTALASVATAVALPPLVPAALNLVREARVSEKRRQELETAHEELRVLYSRLKEFDEVKTRFFANVSHELRTPLALIQGPVERLLESAGPEARGDLQVVARNAHVLRARVDDLLDVARIEAGQLEMSPTDCDLAGVVRVTAGHFDGLAEHGGIDYAVTTPDSLEVRADAEKLRRILMNLLSNAFKFTPRGGRIECRLDVVEQAADPAGRPLVHARLAVSDSGPGVPDDMKERVFQRFVQASTPATTVFGGTGLGLCISREFVEAHGGTLTLERSPLGGALLVVDLPRLEAASRTVPVPAPVSGRVAPEAPPAPPAPPAPAEAPRLLVVEDNRDLQDFLIRSLRSSYRVEAVGDGEEGFRRATAEPPDLILTDVMMPGMAGDELVRQLRARRELDGVPILVLTARADEELRVRLLREGAQDFLLKPFSLEELRARLGIHATLKLTSDVLRSELTGTRWDLVRMAAELTERKREAETALERMRAAREVAERASRIKGDFLRLVSHELRTPLHSMNLHMELLRRVDGPLVDKQEQALDRLEGSWRRLLELVDSLLEYTRIQNRQDHAEQTPVRLRAVAEDVVGELEPRAAAKGLRLEIGGDPDPGEVLSDPRLVRILVRNLVENAIKYTEQGGVTLTLTRAGGEQRLGVSDTGPGIPPDQQARVFQPFEQLEPVQHKHTEGVGLGLAIVREITDSLGGRIELESSPGQGSTFVLALPDRRSA